MSHRNQPPTDARTEVKALSHCLVPMPDDDDTTLVAKLIAFMAVAVWLGITIALTIDAINATAPPFYWAFTAVVFLLVGRLWNLEVEKILPSQ